MSKWNLKKKGSSVRGDDSEADGEKGYSGTSGMWESGKEIGSCYLLKIPELLELLFFGGRFLQTQILKKSYVIFIVIEENVNESLNCDVRQSGDWKGDSTNRTTWQSGMRVKS